MACRRKDSGGWTGIIGLRTETVHIVKRGLAATRQVAEYGITGTGYGGVEPVNFGSDISSDFRSGRLAGTWRNNRVVH